MARKEELRLDGDRDLFGRIAGQATRLDSACTPRSTINRLYSLRNGFWLSESPWAYVGTMHDDWPRMILTAMRQLVMENDPAAAFKTARAAQKTSLCTRTFPEMTANWFYGQILYANRDVPKRS